jgi:hypothetical protein
MSKINLIFVGICLILLVGCGSLPGLSGKKQSFTDEDFRKGVAGVEIKFMPNSPPTELYASDDFSGDSYFTVTAMLDNKGAYDIQEGILVFGYEEDYLELKGWDTKFYGNTQTLPEKNKLSYKLDGKSIAFPKGEKTMISLEAKALPLEKLSSTHDTFVTLTTCYKYMTNANIPVCINNPQYGLLSNVDACQNKEIIKESGQGGPVAVTEVETLLGGKDNLGKIKPMFLITVRNKGNGEALDFFMIQDACKASSLGKEDLNIVFVEATLGNRVLVCDPYRLKIKKQSAGNAKAIVRCTFKEGLEPGEINFETPLNVKLYYGYTNSVSKKITLNKIQYNK